MVLRRLTIALGAALLWAAPAGAHIQVSPTAAAPDDAVLFELLVPNEREESTVEISLQIPKGVLPFSFEDTPGWIRREDKGTDGAVAVVRWSGKLEAERFVRFAFLAATPPEEGELAWKAVQTYDDRTSVRWIGAPGSDEPAAVTTVSRSTPRQNAGGEGEGPAPASGSPTPAAAPAGAARDGDDGRDPLTLGVAFGALVLGAAALVTVRRNR